MKRLVILTMITLAVLVSTLFAQTTEFTYQGKLNDGPNPANASYDFEFALNDAPVGGTQLGPTLSRPGVAVTAGVFAVNLDFGSGFPGAERYLEIRVRPAGGGSFTTLTPRQKISSSPYAIKAIDSTTAGTATNATQLGGVAANQFVQTTDARLSDARNPLPGSTDYIQNRADPQVASNFNISGSGTVGGTLSAQIVNAATQYNLFGTRILTATSEVEARTSLGINAGNNGSSNSFFGYSAGSAVTSGIGNSFFGRNAGASTTTGGGNSFFGSRAGQSNLEGNDNTFLGGLAGDQNGAGSRNTFVGRSAGARNTLGNDNTIIGYSDLLPTQTTGSNNTLVGARADVGINNLTFATAIGAGARVNASNTVALGRPADTVNIPGGLTVAGNTSTGSLNAGSFVEIAANGEYRIGPNEFMSARGTRNTLVGFGTAFGSLGVDNSFFGYVAGGQTTDGSDNAFFGSMAGDANTSGDFNVAVGSNSGGANSTGSSNTFVGTSAGSGTNASNNTFIGRSAGNANTSGTSNTTLGHLSNVGSGGLTFATAIGAGAVASESDSVTLGRSADIVYIPGFLRLLQLGGAGTTQLCRNNANTIGSCSSSLRYKTNLNRFSLGLNLIKQLKPLTFDWKDGGMHDLGLGAEDVAAIEPLLVTYNKSGEVEGVKYDRITVVLINAVKEQQAQIERQQVMIDNLKKLLCAKNRRAAACTQTTPRRQSYVADQTP